MRVQLALLSLAVSSLLVLAFVVPLAAVVRSRAQDQAFDAAEADIAALVPVIAVTDDPDALEAAAGTVGVGTMREVVIATSDGPIVGQTVTPAMRSALANATSTFEERDGRLEVVRVVQSGADELVAVSVTVPRAERFQGVADAWAGLGIAGVLLITLGVVLTDRLARGMVRSVESLSSEAHRLGSGDLTARVDPSGGRELQELGETFNVLGSRVAGMLERERNLLADMSHRMRTPLTRLRLRIEQVEDPELAAALLDDLNDTTDTLSEIIREGRQSLSEREREVETVACDAAAVLRERLDFWQVLADEEDRRVTTEIEHRSMPVAVDEDGLEEVIDVLFDNVFTHTMPGTAFEARLTRNDSLCTLTVSNRLAPVAGSGGSKIGHRIATDRMREHGGRFHTRTVDGCFEACLEMQRARGVFGPA